MNAEKWLATPGVWLIVLGLGWSGGVAVAKPPTQLWTEGTGPGALDPDSPISMRAFAGLAAELTPAVVGVSVKRASGPAGLPFLRGGGGQGLGSGVIIHEDGYVLTNSHVVGDAESIAVLLANEHEYPAKVVGTYAPLDIALLKVDAPEALKVAPLGDSDALQIGEWVIAIGNPFGLSHTVTAGIVSAKGRRDVTPGHSPNLARFIQTDASINPGNSGGPLINIRGEVIGINTAINAAGQGIGFAVPINMIKAVLQQLARGDVARSYLGVMVGPLSPEFARSVGIEDGQGALVSEVKARSPAAAAGMQPGDVVLSFGGQAIAHWEDLPWLTAISPAGRAVALVVNRQGQQRTLQVTPAAEVATAADGTRSGDGVARETRDLGLRVSKLSKAQADALGLGAGQGVVVIAVEEDGLGARLGIQKGDVILQVNYGKVQDPKEFDAAVQATRRGQTLALTLRRGAQFMFKALTL